MKLTAKEEEIEQTKNYLLLTSLRFPGSLTYSVSPAPELLQAKVFPLMLLMLTENSIKANLVMGEAFHIDISGQMYEEAGLMRVHLTHIDSGTGFSEENLLLYNIKIGTLPFQFFLIIQDHLRSLRNRYRRSHDFPVFRSGYLPFQLSGYAGKLADRAIL